MALATLLSACNVEAEAREDIRNETNTTVEVFQRANGQPEDLLARLEPGQHMPLFWNECLSIELVARDRSGNDIERGPAPFCPGDIWVIDRVATPTAPADTWATPSPLPT